MSAIAQRIQSMMDNLESGDRAQLAAPDETQAVELAADDIPTLKRALSAIEQGEAAWIGLKLVSDPEACLLPGDANFPTGSANADSFAFFANDDGEIVCKHEYNDRDRFQMLDVTRGPAMHTGQFAGVNWAAIPLLEKTRVVVFGAGEVSRHLAAFAHATDFETLVLDDDPAFLGAERFPYSALRQVDFTSLDSTLLKPNDFACVLTRNHSFDVEALSCALKADPAYVGMIGHPDKIRRNYEVLRSQGITDAAIAAVHAPIGIKCGGRTPAEIAISIVAELIQTRRERTTV